MNISNCKDESHSVQTFESTPYSSVEVSTQPQPLVSFDGLPPGWGQAVDAEGRVYYLDYTNQTTTWEDPRKNLMGSPVQQVIPTTPSKQLYRCVFNL